MTVPFIKFHPTLTPYLAGQLDAPGRAALDEGYRQAYHELARFLYFNDSKDPIPSRATAVRELPNLRRALDLHLAAGDLDAAVELADRIARFLGVFGRWRERDVMMAKVTQRQGDKVTKSEFLLASRQGETLLDQGRAGEAEALFRALLQRMDGGMAYAGLEAGYDRAITLARLGRSLAAQGQAGAAETVYRQALAALAVLAQTDGVRRETGIAHSNLADVLAVQGRYAEARTEYEAGLAIAETQDDHRQAAVVEGQLGSLALEQGDLAEARQRHRQALESFGALGEEQHEAIAWHQLGRVAQEGKDWDEAERCYRESLAIGERIGNKAGAAQTCNQLAIVAQVAGRPAQAERWYRRAIELGEAIGDQQGLAKRYSNLADLLLTAYTTPDGPRPDLAAAEGYALKAIAIMEQLDLSAQPWNTYNILAQIAEGKGEEAAARSWRRKEQETFAAFPGSWARLQGQFGPVVQAVADAAQGAPGAREAVEKLLGPLTHRGYLLETPIRRIWAGERDVWALTEELDGSDALIVRKILAALAGETAATAPSRSPAPPRPAPQEEGISLQAILALVVAGCQGDLQQGQQAYTLATQVLQHSQQPAQVRALGVALQRLLVGLRQRDDILKGVPAPGGELAAEIVDAVLAQLG